MNAAQREAIMARLAERDPEPSTELVYATPFQLLVAVILSAQSTDRGVNAATAGLFTAAPTPDAMAALGVEGVKGHIRTLGLFNNKARNVVATAQQLVEHHDGEVPRERAALEALPGVGRKTANVILNTAFGEATLAVDTHIFRVANRTGLATGKDVREVEDRLMRLLPRAYLRHAHHWLILHGRYTCTARKPRCGACRIIDLCEYSHKTTAAGTGDVRQ
jgi:endonuclease-3